MKESKYTQAHILAAEAFFNLASLLGKSIQLSAYLLNHPEQKPLVFTANESLSSAGHESESGAAIEGTAPATEAPGQIQSNELNTDGQLAQLLCLYDPRLREYINEVALYDMFHVAASLFHYEMKSPDAELSPSDKKKAAIAWVIVKRAFAINHYDEALHILNLPEVISGAIVYNAPIASRRMDDKDVQYITSACDLCADLVENNIPLEVLIENALKELEREEKTSQIERLAPLGSLPNGDALGWLYRVVSNGDRLRHNSRHESITEARKGNVVQYTRTNKQTGNTFTVEIAQADKYLSKTSKTFKKLLLFSLQKLAAQNEPLEVGFSLQELVDLGMYATTSNAIRGIKEFFAQQKQTTLSGTLKKGRKTIREEGGVLFYHYHIENGYVKLSVNENFNLDFITNYYTVFPRFAYALSNNAFSLVRYIFFLARQNTPSIKDTGSFRINLDSVRENLGLPSPDEVKNRKYKQYIIDPIEDAIEEIEQALETVPEAKEYGFTITPVVPDSNNIHQWLGGYLEIGLKGDFAETFVKLATKAEADRERWNRIKTAELAKLAAKKEAEAAKAEQE